MPVEPLSDVCGDRLERRVARDLGRGRDLAREPREQVRVLELEELLERRAAFRVERGGVPGRPAS